MIFLLAAMDSEISAFIEHIEEMKPHTLFSTLSVYEGTLEGEPVVIAKGGVGKAMCVLSCQRIIDFLIENDKRPDSIIFTGLAGAINPDLRIGDTVVASDCVQHDLDTTTLGHPRGAVPGSPYRFFRADEVLFEAAMTYTPTKGKLHCGRILTGDQFIDDEGLKRYSYLREEFNGDAVEMEGAAVALCAAVNNIPFILIRTISDEADGNAIAHFREFLPRASKNSLEIVRHIIKKITT